MQGLHLESVAERKEEQARQGRNPKRGLMSRLHLWAPEAQSCWDPRQGTLELLHGGWKNPLLGSQPVRATLYVLLWWDVTVDFWAMTLCPFAFLTFNLSSVQFSRSVMSDSLWPHGLQHARLLCPSPSPRAYSNSCLSSWWWHPTVSSSVVPFSSYPQSFPASEFFQMSQLFASLIKIVDQVTPEPPADKNMKRKIFL